MIDADYQASLTGMAGCADSPGHNLTQIMTGTQALHSIIAELRPLLHVAPSDVELANAELALTAKIGRENILRRALAGIDDQFDVCLIDCPPSLSLMTVNALAAAHGVLVPLQPTSVDLRALDLFLATINDVRAQINPHLVLMGTVLTFYDPRYSLHAEVMKALQDASLDVLGTIGRSVKVAEASGAHLPISEYEPGNPQAESFQKLTKAVNKWLRSDHP